MCDERTHSLILDYLASARRQVLERLLFLILLFAYFAYISLISFSIFTPIVILLLCDYSVRVFQLFVVDADRYKRTLDFCCPFLLTLKWPPPTSPRSLPRWFGGLVYCVLPVCPNYVMTRTRSVRRVVDRYVLLILFAMSAKAGQLNFANYICAINIPCLQSVFLRKTGRRVSLRVNPPVVWMPPPPPPSG